MSRCVLLVWFFSTLTAGSIAMAQARQPKRPGYTDTPKLPDSEWRVHDAARPRPQKVDPGSPSTQQQAGDAPSDAIVLFDGKDLSKWVHAGGGEAKWKVEDGAMEVNRTGDIQTAQSFGSCQLHVEWRSSAEVRGEGQARGNSGVFFLGKYEIQVLESHGSETYADGQAAAMYGQAPPDVNACRPAGEWQTYDIVFTSPVFDDKGGLVSPAYATVFHNGVLVHYHRAFLGPTRHKSVPQYAKHETTGPIKLQDHGDPVRYRNVWVRPLDGAK